MTKSNKHKHLTFDDRMEIQNLLNQSFTFKDIAKNLGKDPSCISKEVRKRFTINKSNAIHKDRDQNTITVPSCPLLLKPPYVCNACKKRHMHCSYLKQLYYAKHAHNHYTSLLAESRSGIPLNKEEFYKRDRVITNGIKAGQHLYHILATNGWNGSKSSVYRHLHRGYLSIGAIDLPRVVKFKPRKKKPSKYVPKFAKIGRTYEDFQCFLADNNINQWVEMDTVVGRVGGKLILTLNFSFCNFILGFLLENKSSASVANALIKFKKKLRDGGVLFGDILPLILTDNGSEFSDTYAIENNLDGLRETHLFFCDPMQSCQKPRVEKNHTLLRDIVPKGTSFDDFTQETVDLIFAHINSIKRKVFNGKSAFELFSFAYGENIANIMGIKAIEAEKVVQSPKLLKS